MRPGEADHLAARQAQRDALHHRPAAKRLADVVDHQAFAGEAAGGD